MFTSSLRRPGDIENVQSAITPSSRPRQRACVSVVVGQRLSLILSTKSWLLVGLTFYFFGIFGSRRADLALESQTGGCGSFFRSFLCDYDLQGPPGCLDMAILVDFWTMPRSIRSSFSSDARQCCTQRHTSLGCVYLAVGGAYFLLF